MKPMKPITLTLAQFRQERIVLHSFLHTGDEVIVARQADWNRDGYAQPLPPDGTRAWVVGHTPHFDFVGRKSGHLRSGIYRRYGHAVFQYFNEEGKLQYGPLDPHQLIFADHEIEKQQDRRIGPVWDMYHDGVRVGDLPETPVVEGDVVKVSGKVGTVFEDYDYVAKVDAIEYGWSAIMDQCDPADLAYRLTPLMGGFTTTAPVGEIELLERGNYYWYEQDQSQLKFADVKEKANFYRSVGMGKELRNAATGHYSWTLEQALDYLAEGKGAGIIPPLNMFGSQSTDVHVFDFPNMPELAKEVREETLRGFDRPVAA